MSETVDGMAALQSILPEGHGLDAQQQIVMAASLEELLRKVRKEGGLDGAQLAYFTMGVNFDIEAFRSKV